MPRDDDPFGDPNFEQMVREKAYLLWERDGRPVDGEKHYWYMALAKCMGEREEDERAQRGLIDPI